MLSTPGRSRVPPARRPDAPAASGLWTRVRTGSTPVSTGCARPATSQCRAPHRWRTSTGIAAGQSAVRAGERAVRRSVDRRGRPARRDPDVRRGATATLTAPSTARQRSGRALRAGRVVAACRAQPPERAGAAPWAVADVPRATGAGGSSRLCWSESVAVRLGPCSDQLPARTGRAASAVPLRRPARARPPADAHRRCRVVGVPREQAHVPAEQPPPVQDPRLPAAHAYPRGPGDPRRPSAQGSREALRLTCCPRRHACAGVRSSPRSSGPGGAPGGRPWCSTTSPNGPQRPGRRAGIPGRAGRFRRRQGRRQLRGPPPGDPAAARRRPRRAAPAARRRPTWSSGPVPRRPTAASRQLRRDLRAGLDRLLAATGACAVTGPCRPARWPAAALLAAIRLLPAGDQPRPAAALPLLPDAAAPTPPRRSSVHGAARGSWLARAPAGQVRPLAPGRRRPRAAARPEPTRAARSSSTAVPPRSRGDRTDRAPRRPRAGPAQEESSVA